MLFEGRDHLAHRGIGVAAINQIGEEIFRIRGGRVAETGEAPLDCRLVPAVPYGVIFLDNPLADLRLTLYVY